jgi:DNA-binding sugar fermentation-stimulating protein
MDELSDDDDFIVTTTDDGRMFHCSVAKIGAEREQRWVLIDTDRQLHIGPAWSNDMPEPQLRKLVNEWWRTRKREQRFDASR